MKADIIFHVQIEIRFTGLIIFMTTQLKTKSNECLGGPGGYKYKGV